MNQAEFFRAQGFDLRQEALYALSEVGIQSHSNAVEMMWNATHTLLFMFNGEQAKEVICGPGSLSGFAANGIAKMFCETMVLDEASGIGEGYRENGWRVIGPLVSGGAVAQVEVGT